MAKTNFATTHDWSSQLNIAALAPNWYYCRVEHASEILDEPGEWPISGAGKAAFVQGSQTAAADLSSDTVTSALEAAKKPTPNPCCLWCGRAFRPRATGGSAQKFCSTGHRQEFWIAARRWTMKAIDAGLISVDCLKAARTSVHAP